MSTGETELVGDTRCRAVGRSLVQQVLVRCSRRVRRPVGGAKSRAVVRARRCPRRKAAQRPTSVRRRVVVVRVVHLVVVVVVVFILVVFVVVVVMVTLLLRMVMVVRMRWLLMLNAVVWQRRILRSSRLLQPSTNKPDVSV